RLEQGVEAVVRRRGLGCGRRRRRWRGRWRRRFRLVFGGGTVAWHTRAVAPAVEPLDHFPGQAPAQTRPKKVGQLLAKLRRHGESPQGAFRTTSLSSSAFSMAIRDW